MGGGGIRFRHVRLPSVRDVPQDRTRQLVGGAFVFSAGAVILGFGFGVGTAIIGHATSSFNFFTSSPPQPTAKCFDNGIDILWGLPIAVTYNEPRPCND